MSQTMPRKERDCVGPVTDTHAWNGFELRADDVVVSTPPKAGTTWMQTIILMLLQKTAKLDGNVWQLAPWIDCVFRPEAPARLNAMSHRRCIKTHSPLDAIKYAPDATYIVAQRHPVDIHFSLRRHVENMKSDMLDFMYSGDISADFDRFLTQGNLGSGTDDTTLASIVEHFRSFKRWERCSNIHFFHYADMQRDPAGQIGRLNTLLGTDCDPALLEEIAKATSFAAMKSHAARHLRTGADTPFKDELKFFATARSGKWEGRLSTEEMNRFHAALSAQLNADEADWLSWGSRG